MSGKSKKSSAAVDRPFSKMCCSTQKKTGSAVPNHSSLRGRALVRTRFGIAKCLRRRQNGYQCMESTREALVGAVALLLERGKAAEACPGGSSIATSHIRLTAEEKVMLKRLPRARAIMALAILSVPPPSKRQPDEVPCPLTSDLS